MQCLAWNSFGPVIVLFLPQPHWNSLIFFLLFREKILDREAMINVNIHEMRVRQRHRERKGSENQGVCEHEREKDKGGRGGEGRLAQFPCPRLALNTARQFKSTAFRISDVINLVEEAPGPWGWRRRQRVKERGPQQSHCPRVARNTARQFTKHFFSPGHCHQLCC